MPVREVPEAEIQSYINSLTSAGGKNSYGTPSTLTKLNFKPYSRSTLQQPVSTRHAEEHTSVPWAPGVARSPAWLEPDMATQGSSRHRQDMRRWSEEQRGPRRAEEAVMSNSQGGRAELGGRQSGAGSLAPAIKREDADEDDDSFETIEEDSLDSGDEASDTLSTGRSGIKRDDSDGEDDSVEAKHEDALSGDEASDTPGPRRSGIKRDGADGREDSVDLKDEDALSGEEESDTPSPGRLGNKKEEADGGEEYVEMGDDDALSGDETSDTPSPGLSVLKREDSDGEEDSVVMSDDDELSVDEESDSHSSRRSVTKREHADGEVESLHTSNEHRPDVAESPSAPSPVKSDIAASPTIEPARKKPSRILTRSRANPQVGDGLAEQLENDALWDPRFLLGAAGAHTRVTDGSTQESVQYSSRTATNSAAFDPSQISEVYANDTQPSAERDAALCLFASTPKKRDDLSSYEPGMQRFWALYRDSAGNIDETTRQFMQEVMTASERSMDRSIPVKKRTSNRRAWIRGSVRQHLERMLAGSAHEPPKVPVKVTKRRKAGLTGTYINSTILGDPVRFLARLKVLGSDGAAHAIDSLVDEAWFESQVGEIPDPGVADLRTSNKIRRRRFRFREAAIEHMSQELAFVQEDSAQLAEIRSELQTRTFGTAKATLMDTYINGSVLGDQSRLLARLRTSESDNPAGAIDSLVHEAWLESQAGETPDPGSVDRRASDRIRRRHFRFRQAAMKHISQALHRVEEDNDQLAGIRSELQARLLATSKLAQEE
ncbi:uncharacterized protein MKK02DRAFT_29775 [Dioszegia hungarica]|uniref:Uncharacterized protein n=1 Tax=Dioszegia hungarica TaxID=4972 RepID=A0AA38LYY3_9TREE|nr:uncharacterized protein MKK02DRAFT_29775 [Dioszegia hungarica]KAI9639796.1 hypothetical protein MKK02DRAFT_29775 [Dioszegia hungarica]